MQGRWVLNLVAKIKLLLQENELDKIIKSVGEANKKKQEFTVGKETQCEQLSKAQEVLKQKMRLLELAQKQSSLSNDPEDEATTST